MSLTDQQRKLIHDLALEARQLLMREARELLEGTYGLYPDGRMDPPQKLPEVQTNPEAEETYNRLKTFIEDEVAAGLARDEAVDKLVKEVAYTHLNRLAAFKMMEARKLIRGTLDKGPNSNAFLYYLADPQHAEDYALYQQGEVDTAYRHFLLWQSGQVAQEIRVLFDPDNLVSRLFPRPRALEALLSMLNKEALADAWLADETVGWIYQYFNEPELQAAFAKVGGGEKFEAEDIPSATQLFTPHWIVRYLVQNTLGRLWVQMHTDTRLIGTELLDYLVPLKGEVPAEPLRPVKEITLLDPACGGMHFGLVAFDLFHAMYTEELERAGEPGWPENASVDNEAEIPAAIIKYNLFGIDIDLRAVQLAALALFLKAKSYNKNAKITDSNLVVAGVLPLNGARLGAFLRDAHFTRPVYERLLRALWTRLQNARQLGSLLRLEKDLAEMVETERKRYEQAPLFAGIPGEFEAAATDEAFWEVVGSQIVRSLHEFAQEQAREGHDQAFFVGEAVKGMRLLELMLREYDVVVTNPPYMTRGKMNTELAKLVADAYPKGKNDLFAAFIQRCLEFAGDTGYVGMLTMHSFMFLSSYEGLRQEIRQQATISSMIHCGPALFDVGNPGTLQTTAFVLHREEATIKRENSPGTYFRLVHASDADGKRLAFERALEDRSNMYHVVQRRFSAIPRSPWGYWVHPEVIELFETNPYLAERADVRLGLSAVDVFRFNRQWWEVSDPQDSVDKWFPLMKGGSFQRWYGNNSNVVNWADGGKEMKEEVINRYPYLKGNYSLKIRDEDALGKPGLTYTNLGGDRLSVRVMPKNALFDDTGPAIISHETNSLVLLATLNSRLSSYLLSLMNPSIHFQKGDLQRLPLPKHRTKDLSNLAQNVKRCVWLSYLNATLDESTYDFVMPEGKLIGNRIEDLLTSIEDRIDSLVSQMYGVETSLFTDDSGFEASTGNTEGPEESEGELHPAPVRWISYAIGIILSRFQPGTPNTLGNAIYHPSQFAIGSLPEPSVEEFDELIGSYEQFAYVDADGGRHVFSPEVEQALRNLTLPDGIAVLDKGHPRDLPALVKRALELMLDAEQAQEVIATGANGDLRKFLERAYFVNYHVKQDWYRKRPVYWPLQSAKRNYGFVLFHEKIDDQTFYTLQRDYLDHKLNSLRLHIEDLRGQMAGRSGAALKQVERKIAKAAQLLEEIGEFARTMERVVQEGYQPKPNWIDDGIILRMAPLWELIPTWKAEPKKYWERLQRGDFDWSHIAMNYWPERVREACKGNKSFAIAHGIGD